MLWILLLGILCILICVVALGGKVVKSRLFRGDGAIPLPLQKIKGLGGRIVSPPPAAPERKGHDLFDDAFIDELSDKIASKIKVEAVVPERKRVDLTAQDEVECVSIDDSLIDPGSDISDLKSEGIEAREEVKQDDIKKAKEGLSKLKSKRGRKSKSSH